MDLTGCVAGNTVEPSLGYKSFHLERKTPDAKKLLDHLLHSLLSLPKM